MPVLDLAELVSRKVYDGAKRQQAERKRWLEAARQRASPVRLARADFGTVA